MKLQKTFSSVRVQSIGGVSSYCTYQSVTVIIKTELQRSTGTEKMVCNQRRTEAGASHFFGLCTLFCAKHI